MINQITDESLVDLVFQLKWKSRDADHHETYLAGNVNIWRDYLIPDIKTLLMGKKTGDQIRYVMEPGSLVANFNGSRMVRIPRDQFDPNRNLDDPQITPRSGRFYPQGVLRGIPGVFRANVQPFRCVGVQNGTLAVDLNHPLAGKKATLSATVGKVDTKQNERGGTSIDWIDQLANGPGMQARWNGVPTDYFSDNPYARSDEASDDLFYQKPRLVDHLDKTAIGIVSDIYGRLLKDDMDILDLMSSWHSHLPDNLRLGRVTGLGLNQEELDRNHRLDERVVHDLNKESRLPFADASFDAVVSTVSVEYLVHPISVFKEIRRVLRPEGYCIITFSNRWFPPKAIQIWQELHEFERMGLVLDYFINADGFSDLKTYSIRGLPRPADDKYYHQLPFADPVYAVWGRKT